MPGLVMTAIPSPPRFTLTPVLVIVGEMLRLRYFLVILTLVFPALVSSDSQPQYRQEEGSNEIPRSPSNAASTACVRSMTMIFK